MFECSAYVYVCVLNVGLGPVEVKESFESSKTEVINGWLPRKDVV